MSKLLIDDYPIQVLPNLAKKIGLNEAIILQQIHYWINNSKHHHAGKCWIYNSYREWEKQFPFWSNATIRRAISSLEKQNLLITGNFNKAGFDKTKWYTIDYIALNSMSKCIAQNEQTDCSKRANGVAQNEQTNTIDYTETTSETTNNKNILSSSDEQDSIPYKEIMDYFNLKTNKDLKSSTAKTRQLIKARWNEGFKIEDFRKVIDNKCFDWLVPGKTFSNGTPTSTYVRPSTIFGPRFEEYLQENNIPKDQNNESGGMGWE